MIKQVSSLDRDKFGTLLFHVGKISSYLHYLLNTVDPKDLPQGWGMTNEEARESISIINDLSNLVSTNRGLSTTDLFFGYKEYINDNLKFTLLTDLQLRTLYTEDQRDIHLAVVSRVTAPIRRERIVSHKLILDQHDFRGEVFHDITWLRKPSFQEQQTAIPGLVPLPTHLTP